MSIIHEALKKTGQTVINETPQAPKPAEKNQVRITPVSHKKASANWKPLLVLAILVIAAAPLFAGRILNSNNSASRPLGQFGVEEIPVTPAPSSMFAPKRSSAAPFQLSGVVYEGKDSYCLINGLVLKVGDSVGGAKVTKITPEAVTLDLNGQAMTLPVTTG